MTLLRGFDKTWLVDDSRHSLDFPKVDQHQEGRNFTRNENNVKSDDEENEDDDDETKTSQRSFVKKFPPVIKPKHQVPVLRYPVDARRSKRVFEITNARLKGRRALFPVKKKIPIQRLIPLTIVAESEDFRVLQDGDEWERVQFAVKERAAGSKEHHDVTEEEQVRVGPYMLCTKCAGFNTKPQRPALSDGKRGGLGDTSMYQTWRSSLLELQPYLDMRDKMQRNRLKKGQKEKSEEKKEDEGNEEKDDAERNDLNFDNAYSLLAEAMKKIETSSNKTQRRLRSATNSSHKFTQSHRDISRIEEVEGEISEEN